MSAVNSDYNQLWFRIGGKIVILTKFRTFARNISVYVKQPSPAYPKYPSGVNSKDEASGSRNWKDSFSIPQANHACQMVELGGREHQQVMYSMIKKATGVANIVQYEHSKH